MGVPIIRILVFWGLYWGPLFWETPIWHVSQAAEPSAFEDGVENVGCPEASMGPHTHLPFLQGLFFVGLWDPVRGPD